MRKFRRALSLALASVMMLGMMTVGAGASYNDVTAKEHEEAIGVLQAVGVMVGDEKGNFNPSQPVTREEMAAVMAKLMDYKAESYKGTSPFKDVSEWAEPFVAACYANGLVAGYGSDIYGGKDGVTAGQAALMLMKALGYFEYQSDYGTDWLVATAKQANKIDLFDDVDAGINTNLTRNDVAQLVLNALKADCVESDGNGGITVEGDGFTVSSGKATYVTRMGTADKYKKFGDEANNEKKYALQLGEDLFDGDLVIKGTEGDEFGRPGTTWEYKTEEIGTYADSADYTYMNKVSKGTLYRDLGKSLVDDLKAEKTVKTGNTESKVNKLELHIWVDGEDLNAKDQNRSQVVDALAVKNNSGHIMFGKDKLTGNGVQTEVYIDEDDNVNICIINTYVMQATSDYNKSKENLSIEAKTGDFKGTKLDLDDFDTLNTFKEDDYILYTYAGNEVQSIAKAKVVEGKVNSAKSDSVKLDGTSYDYSKVYTDAEHENIDRFTVDEKASIVVDANGFLVWVDDAAIASGSYVYVQNAETQDLGKTAKAGIYTADGEYAVVEVKKVKDSNSDTTNADEMANGLNGAPGWYSYTKDSNGRYTLTKTATSEKLFYKNDTDKTQTIIKGESVKFLNITKGNKVTVGENTTVRGNSNTVFIVDDGDDITLYKGINAAPTITLAKDQEITVTYLLKDDKNSSSYASLVFVDAENADLDEATTNEQLMYVLQLDSTYKDANDTVNVYNVLLEGKETTVESTDELQTGLYYKLKKDSDGRITDGSKLFSQSTDSKYIKDNNKLDKAEVEYDNGSLLLGNHAYTLDKDAKIVLILMKGAGEVMDDQAADYEISSGISGHALESALKDYKVSGAFYGIRTESDKDSLTTLYVVVTGSQDAVN